MVRTVDNNARSKEILKATIELYLETAQPVSSEILLKKYRLDCCSATIRNVLNDLEEKGYLTHPHTSAGRIPTDLGYRFYINELMKTIELSRQEKDTLDDYFDSYLEAFDDDLFVAASQIISHLTHYAAIANLESPYKMYYSGLSYLLEQPEFHENIDTTKDVVKALEEDRLLNVLRRQMRSDIDIFIGNECDCPGMSNCALIISECKSPKKNVGKLAVLGPKRMAYKRVIPMVDYLSELILKEVEE